MFSTAYAQTPEADFQARCSAPGVTACMGFDNASDFVRASSGTGLRGADQNAGPLFGSQDSTIKKSGSSLKFHIPSDLVVELLTTHRKPPEVRICRLSIQSDVGTRPPSTSTPHSPVFLARR